MMRSLALLCAVIASSDAFSVSPVGLRAGLMSSRAISQGRTAAPLAALSMQAAAPSLSPARPPSLVPGSPLPRIYVYDHCPFCVRARMIFGLKNIKHEVRFMPNDDVKTPTDLVGKKIAPILEMPYLGEVMKESMDIVKRIDEDPALGTPILRPASDRADIKAWQKAHANTFRALQRPRYVMTGLLPEFAQAEAREMFIKNHQMVGYEKADWKDDSKFTQEQRKAEYQKALEQTASLLPQANAALNDLEALIFSPEHCSEGGLSYDDIDLFARLRSITIIRGIVMPPKVNAYMQTMSSWADIPLYTAMAL
eukprot:CAMPEP_0177716138 /NCGR_PEP_ID=MMETSP0484_2-20121128/14360_1 /TAXON_ID=354590 /ORGANISM="Rhodomonas lens, Strain RHODO" /LENGTH=309 /DNA_ID=CAMNT_0019228169 /DNA_START=21 /DNA_END=950 /DNA_ORIENTATION=+